ncbi:hypothetical protein AALP_AAs40079U000200 [Arabis alpina]|uniref:Uncharacterized protein n=1 Tax=Arabis alpina TaxID=50452 RepID=A0A087G137_ARAAL|nr:hypothetical protein AALP_AAs40079U000200 [Arabis alpina]
MVKKQKFESSCLDEVDRTMYDAFRGAANSLFQLYTHAMNHQRVSFLASERPGMRSFSVCNLYESSWSHEPKLS